MSDLCTRYKKIVVVGDFNLHWDNPHRDLATRQLNTAMSSLSFKQLVEVPTHIKGHTLDLVWTSDPNITLSGVLPCVWTDHYLVNCEAHIDGQSSDQSRRLRKTRNWDEIDLKTLTEILPKVARPLVGTDLDWEYTDLTRSLRQAIDQIAPERIQLMRGSGKGAPWFTPLLREHKRKLRALERSWRKTKQDTARDQYKASLYRYKKLILQTKAEHYECRLNKAGNIQKETFKILAELSKKSESSEINIDCNTLQGYFLEKVENIISEIKSNTANGFVPYSDPHNSTDCTIMEFPEIDVLILEQLMGKTKSGSPADPCPPRVFREVRSILEERIISLLNRSLKTGYLPVKFKETRVRPLLKKPSADPAVLKNYRPISQLPFLSKILEQHVLKFLSLYVESHDLLHRRQAGF
ncbi:uncharacterized protein LOC144772083 [Lissotriton helveticus]